MENLLSEPHRRDGAFSWIPRSAIFNVIPLQTCLRVITAKLPRTAVGGKAIL